MTLSPYPCLYVKPDGNCPYTPTYQARECVSGTAWWGSQYTGKPWPRGWGNALNWPAMARAAGFTVNASCAPNTIMCVPPLTNGSGAMGHVAYVVGAVQAGRAEVWEMDFEVRFGFGTRPAPVHQCEFIHLVAAPAPDPPSLPGESDMWLYQLTNGSIYLVQGGVKLTLGTGADAQVYMTQGVKLYHQTQFTALYQATLAKVPVV